MPEWIDTESLLFTVMWQATFWLVVGAVTERMLAARPARGHGLLLLCVVAAVVSPAMTAVFEKLGWGWWAPLTVDGADNAVALPDGAARPEVLPTWLTAANMFWACAGTLATILLIRLGRSFTNGVTMVARSMPIKHARARQAARSASARLGLEQPPLLRLSDSVRCPVIWCWGHRPRILLPEAVLEEPSERLETIICHELAHWKRRDHVTSLAAEIATCLLAWHPLMWFARRRLKDLHEQACDAWVLWTGAAPARYADTLLSLVPHEAPMVSLAAVHDRQALRRRIERIFDAPRRSPAIGRPFACWALAIAATLTASTALAQRRTVETSAIDPEGSWPIPVAADPLSGGTAQTAGIEVRPAELDLGTAPPGAIATGTIWLVNHGARPVAVIEAKASCGCTTVQDVGGLVLAARRATPVEISMEASGVGPGQRKTKHVTFRFEGDGIIKIPVHVTIEATVH